MELTDLVRHAAERTSYSFSLPHLSCTSGNVTLLSEIKMSDQEFSREQDHTLGSEVPTVSQPATLTPSFVSNAIKEAFGSFKEYFDSSIAQVKEESEKKLSAASTTKKGVGIVISFQGQ